MMKSNLWQRNKPVYGDNINPEDLVVEGGVVDSEYSVAEDAEEADTTDAEAASDDTKDADTADTDAASDDTKDAETADAE